MPVVINEFEVVPAAEPNPTAAQTANQPEPAKPPQLSDYETEKLLDRRLERSLRIHAH